MMINIDSLLERIRLTEELDCEWRKARHELEDEDIYKLIGIGRSSLTLDRYREAISRLREYNEDSDLWFLVSQEKGFEY